MISEQKNIAAVFSLFHDGVIASHLAGNNGLVLIVDIAYLANRINPAFTKFLVCLFGVRDIQFHTWPNEADNASHTLLALEDIFKPKLDILQAEARGDIVEVVCNQVSPDFPYGGGELQFQADCATVSDEAGKFWSLAELDALSKTYWDEWSNAGGKKS